MEKSAATQRSSPCPRRAGAGGLEEHRARSFPKKVGAYRGNAGNGSSYHSKKPKSSGRAFSKNLERDSNKWQARPSEFSKESAMMKNDPDQLSSLEADDELASFETDKISNKFLNFQYASSNRHQCGPYGWHKQASQRYSRQTMYNKESYLQANCQFIVKEEGDYSLHTVDPDTLVDWTMIEQICLCSHEIPSCPICLDTPRVARITRCGHVYCWSCIIHYLQLGEKQWRKCPICFEAIIPSDLKSVVTTAAHKFKAGETIDMKLMQRKKGSMLSKPISAESVAPTIEWKGDLGSIIRTVHAKLLKASPKIVHEKILSLELKALEEQLKEAKSEQSGEESFIEIAIVLLKEKETELLKKMKESSKTVPKCDTQTDSIEKGGVPKTKKIMDVLQEQMAAASVDEPAFSDDEEPNGNAEEKPSQYGKASQEEHSPVSPSNSLSDTHAGKGTATPDYYFYYQAKDGQNIFLQPVNVRCLVHEYGSLQTCPEYISAQIIDIETHTMTKELRKRFRYLSHLPLYCEFTFCELMIRPPTLSRETLGKFANEFYERKMTRQRKKREERKLERKIEKARTMDSFGRVLDFEPEATSVDLQSLEDFPSQIGSVSPDGPIVSPPTGRNESWGVSSFAKALQKSTHTPVQRKEESRPRKVSETNWVSAVKGTSDPLDEDYVPVPSFASAFSEAFSSALEKRDAAGENSASQKVKRKKQKGKKLLFTTSNGPKYS